jgi:hypothetical protein
MVEPLKDIAEESRGSSAFVKSLVARAPKKCLPDRAKRVRRLLRRFRNSHETMAQALENFEIKGAAANPILARCRI